MTSKPHNSPTEAERNAAYISGVVKEKGYCGEIASDFSGVSIKDAGHAGQHGDERWPTDGEPHSVLQNANRNPLKDNYEFDADYERSRAEGVLANTDLWVRQQDAAAMLAALNALRSTQEQVQTWEVTARANGDDYQRLKEQFEAAEKARKDLTHALAFYADFEESGHSDWSVATDTLVAHYGTVPQPGESIPALANPATSRVGAGVEPKSQSLEGSDAELARGEPRQTRSETTDVSSPASREPGQHMAHVQLNGLLEQLEALRQALRDSWDDYALAIDEHASDEVRKEARHAMLLRFSAFQDEGWLDSNPAIRPDASDTPFEKPKMQQIGESLPASRQDS